jgi:glycosyltransferase involved in cell wall biosynthesis
MNILILHGSSDLYGASKILLVTVRLLIKKGDTPIVVLTENGPLADELKALGAEVIFIPLGILRRKYKTIPGIINRLSVIRNAYSAIKTLIKERKIGLVYSNTTAVLAGAFAASSLGIRHIWHVHEIIEHPKWMYRFLGGLLNRYSHKVIVVSEAVQKSWSKYVSPEKLQLVYNGIDYSPYLLSSGKLRKELGIDDQTVVIGMIGRVHYWKGQAYFLQIASALSKQYDNVRFVLIGDAFPGYEYLYEQLGALIKQENIGHLVTDLGYRTDVAELLHGFDILVLPSTLPDPFPTVVLEAMASAKPVAATAHGGALEMVDENGTGVLIPLNDVQKASLIIGKLISNKVLRIQMGEAARKKVLEEYSTEAFENKMINVLE